jgi:nitrate reductase (cytochrome)
MTETLSRRDFLKTKAAAMAAAAGGMAMPAAAANLVTDKSDTQLGWDKAACRFCGTGCSVMVGTMATSSPR